MKKCPYCGAQLNDDSKFCTECGKPIPQGNVCPHCGASVNNDDAFCQNCGKRVEDSPSIEATVPSQRNCPYCGASLNNDAVFCENCGKQVKDNNSYITDQQLQTSSHNGNLTIKWDGTFALVDAKIRISVNQSILGEYSFKQGFETTIPITSSNMELATKVGFCSATERLELDTNENYTYELAYHRMSGWFGFILYDNDGFEIRRDKLHWGLWILSLLLPIVGFIYAIVGWKKRPAASYTALYAALLGFIISFTFSYRIANMRSDTRTILDEYKNRNDTTLVQDTDSIGEVVNESVDSIAETVDNYVDSLTIYEYAAGGDSIE